MMPVLERLLDKYPQFRPFVQKALENKTMVFLCFLCVLLLFPLFCSRAKPDIYYNEHFGYQILIPSSWRKSISSDKTVVTLRKRQSRNLGRAEIKLHVDIGNPYGTKPFDYAYYGLLPRVRNMYEKKEGRTFRVRDYPYTKIFSGKEWGIFSFVLDYDELYVIYVTQKGDFTYIFTLITSGKKQREAESDLLEIVRTVFIERRDRVNVFTDPNADVIFSHPL
jgi:hypothetical protein